MRDDYFLFMASLVFFVFAVFLYMKRENRDFERLLHRLNGIQMTADSACKAAAASNKTSAETRTDCLAIKTQIVEIQQKQDQPKPINVNLSSTPIEVILFEQPKPNKK
jgi:hypothetical protein